MHNPVGRHRLRRPFTFHPLGFEADDVLVARGEAQKVEAFPASDVDQGAAFACEVRLDCPKALILSASVAELDTKPLNSLRPLREVFWDYENVAGNNVPNEIRCFGFVQQIAQHLHLSIERILS